MAKNPSNTPETQNQIDRFKEAARALGAGEDEAAFDEKLKVIAKQKPKTEPKAPKQKGDEASDGRYLWAVLLLWSANREDRNRSLPR